MAEWRRIRDTQYCVSSEGNVRWGMHEDKYTKYMKPGKAGQSKHLMVGLRINNSNKSFKLARLVAEAFIPNPQELPYVIHIDGNRENNTVENLRWATLGEAKRLYSPVHKDNKTGLKGACLHKATGKYQSIIMFDGVRYYLGRFDTPEEAHKAYNEKFKELSQRSTN